MIARLRRFGKGTLGRRFDADVFDRLAREEAIEFIREEFGVGK